MAARIDIVVKPIFRSRAGTELDAGVDGFQRLGHQVSRGVPEGGLSVFVVPGKELQPGVAFEGARRVPHFAIDFCGEHFFGQPMADRLGNIERRRACFILAHLAIGESDVDHVCLRFRSISYYGMPAEKVL